MRVQVGRAEFNTGEVLPPSMVDDLVSFLSERGFEAEAHPSEFGVGVDPVGVASEIAVWVEEHLAGDAALALAAVVARWCRGRYRQWKKPDHVRVLYGPTGEVLAEVRITED